MRACSFNVGFLKRLASQAARNSMHFIGMHAAALISQPSRVAWFMIGTSAKSLVDDVTNFDQYSDRKIIGNSSP